MDRRDFLASSAAAGIGLTVGSTPVLGAGEGRAPAGSPPEDAPMEGLTGSAAGSQTPRQIVIAGGGFGTAFIRYVAELTGKERPKLCYLPTASADRESGIIRWYENCAPLDVIPSVQESFISSYTTDRSWEEVFLSVDGIVVSGGNTLNQQAIWRAQGIDVILREAWNRGIVLGGASAGSLCWFEEGTTDSRPREVTKVECLGFLRGSHSPHYDAEAARRPTYHRMIASGELKPGYACDNDAGIHFIDNDVHRVLKTREDARVYFVTLEAGAIVETELPGEMIA